jgi:hypothetical protein
MYYIMHKQLNKDMCADNTMVCFTGWDGGGDVYVCGRGAEYIAKGDNRFHNLLAHGRWFSPGTPASSTTKTGRHDIAEILLKVTLKTIN